MSGQQPGAQRTRRACYAGVAGRTLVTWWPHAPSWFCCTAMSVWLPRCSFLAGLTGSPAGLHREIDEWLNPGYRAVGEAAAAFSGSLVQRTTSLSRQLVGTWSIPEGRASGVVSPPCRARPAPRSSTTCSTSTRPARGVGKRLWAACASSRRTWFLDPGVPPQPDLAGTGACT
ncbi:hypothetical protein P4123_01355 [Pseudomonas aeruginosa]|nr:hypothetical protein [Pseudomonas aeruginosa]